VGGGIRGINGRNERIARKGVAGEPEACADEE